MKKEASKTLLKMQFAEKIASVQALTPTSDFPRNMRSTQATSMSGSQFRPNTGSIRKSQYKVKISGSKKVEKQSVLNPDMFNETVFYRDAKDKEDK